MRVEESIMATLREHLTEDVLVLRPIVDRLTRLIRDDGAESAGAHGDPDGYDGLSRRGILERLVASEWALLDDLPDEFFRRMLMHEQAHYQLARSAETVERALCVILDLSPRTAGTLRVVVLAAFLVLAERAARRQRPFQWQVLGDPHVFERQPHAADLLQVLNRCDAATDIGSSFSKAWFIGDHAGAEAATKLGCVTIAVDDTYDLQPAARIEVNRARVTVALPSVDDVRRLSAGKQSRPKVPQGTKAFDTSVPPLLVDRGRRVVAMHKDGSLFLQPVPQSTAGHVGSIVRLNLPAKHKAHAVAWHNRRALVLASTDGMLFEHSFGKRGGGIISRNLGDFPYDLPRALRPYVVYPGWFDSPNGRAYHVKTRREFGEGRVVDGAPDRQSLFFGKIDGVFVYVLAHKTEERVPMSAVDLDSAVVSTERWYIVDRRFVRHGLQPNVPARTDFAAFVEKAGGTEVVGATHKTVLVYNRERGGILRIAEDGAASWYVRVPHNAHHLLLHHTGVFVYFDNDGELRFSAGGAL